jgi:hypothetical protein
MLGAIQRGGKQGESTRGFQVAACGLVFGKPGQRGAVHSRLRSRVGARLRARLLHTAGGLFDQGADECESDAASSKATSLHQRKDNHIAPGGGRWIAFGTG